MASQPCLRGTCPQHAGTPSIKTKSLGRGGTSGVSGLLSGALRSVRGGSGAALGPRDPGNLRPCPLAVAYAVSRNGSALTAQPSGLGQAVALRRAHGVRHRGQFGQAGAPCQSVPSGTSGSPVARAALSRHQRARFQLLVRTVTCPQLSLCAAMNDLHVAADPENSGTAKLSFKINLPQNR